MKRGGPSNLHPSDGQHINVYARIRPFNKQEIEKNCIESVTAKNNKDVHVSQTYTQKLYSFDHVFGPYSVQADVFEVTVTPLIFEILKGYNCTILAYGQTGSGKTYTIVGEDNNEKAGIIPRAVEKIYELLRETDTKTSMLVSFLELYNEELFDLLSSETEPKSIRIFDDIDKRNSVILHGLEEVSVSSKNEVLELLERGCAKRHIAPTLMNVNSSRSHTVFTVTIHMREESLHGEVMMKTGKLNLVDLAGSENIGKSGSVERRAREAGSINQSLLTLGRVINALTEKTRHVPYRESKLTRILQDSLGGRTKTSLIATISPAYVNMEETISTLEYAVRVRSIQNKPEVNLQLSKCALMKAYQLEIKKLKNELKRYLKGGSVYVDEDNYNQMITNKENFSTELDLKNENIYSLEELLAKTKEKFEMIQKNWTDATSNIDALVRQKVILQEDLITIKDKKEENKVKLENFRMKHQKVKNKAKVLLSTAKMHSQNEEILHHKVNFLYNVSHHNVKSLRDFRCLYDNISMEMMNIVDECVLSCDSLNELKELITNFKTKLDGSYNTLKSNIQELSAVCHGLDEFENKQSVIERVLVYLGELEEIIDNTFIVNNKTLEKISSVFSHDVQQMIHKVNTESGNRYKQFIITTLHRLHDDILKTNENMCVLVDESLEGVQRKFGKAEKLNQKLKIKLAEQRLIREKDNEGNKKLNRILNRIDKFEQKYEILYELNNRQYNLSLTMKSTYLEAISDLRSKIEPCILQHQTRLHQQAETLQAFKQEDTSQGKCINDLIEKTKENMQEKESQVSTIFEQLNNNVSEYGENVLNREKFCKKLTETVSESNQDLIDTISSASTKIDDTNEMCSDVIENVEFSKNGCLEKMQAASNSYDQYYEEMRKNVKDFCYSKVPHVVNSPPHRQK